ncbi:hypothetical protein PARMER_01398 [Parabacteroides merdae ATCC 43184]|nr:hypothetical protein PARMER_01398 [Parabacteroides merdae ATCC 43184]
MKFWKIDRFLANNYYFCREHIKYKTLCLQLSVLAF